jgi:hypothetical protein
MFVPSVRPELDRLVDDDTSLDTLHYSSSDSRSYEVRGISGYIIRKECYPWIGSHERLTANIGRRGVNVLLMRGSRRSSEENPFVGFVVWLL